LGALLDTGRVDAALVPVIDFLTPGRRWKVISDGCIGCDGETLTVRVFSRVPPASIRRLHVDGDSHTSVALARIIWAELHGVQLEVIPFDPVGGPRDCEAVLLIGDKVVRNRLVDHDIQTDLGQAWKSLTTFPFVFAVWAVAEELENSDGLAAKLSSARDLGVRTAEMIAADLGPGMGWPVALARRYLTKRLKFTLGPREKEGMARFFELARRQGIVGHTVEPMVA
jgi:chorismate dehydratase